MTDIDDATTTPTDKKHHWAASPPSTRYDAPVMNDALSDARKTMVAAISSSLPTIKFCNSRMLPGQADILKKREATISAAPVLTAGRFCGTQARAGDSVESSFGLPKVA